MTRKTYKYSDWVEAVVNKLPDSLPWEAVSARFWRTAYTMGLSPAEAVTEAVASALVTVEMTGDEDAA